MPAGLTREEYDPEANRLAREFRLGAHSDVLLAALKVKWHDRPAVTGLSLFDFNAWLGAIWQTRKRKAQALRFQRAAAKAQKQHAAAQEEHAARQSAWLAQYARSSEATRRLQAVREREEAKRKATYAARVARTYAKRSPSGPSDYCDWQVWTPQMQAAEFTRHGSLA
jgi:hypothetical protein